MKEKGIDPMSVENAKSKPGPKPQVEGPALSSMLGEGQVQNPDTEFSTYNLGGNGGVERNVQAKNAPLFGNANISAKTQAAQNRARVLPGMIPT